jgi:Putative adhesin
VPTFDTPAPILVTLEVSVADIRIVASDRADTVVEVRPSDSSKEADVNAAGQTRVEFAGGRLLVKMPKRGWRQFTPPGGSESIDVQLELPAGSNVQGEAGLATLRTMGRLGECRFKAGKGDIHIDQAGLVQLASGAGDITLDRAAGHVAVSTGSGALRLGHIDGSAVIKDSNGETWVDEVTGELRVSAANGTISVNHAGSRVVAKTANGDVYLEDIVRGPVLAETARGNVDVGVREGLTAWLNLDTQFGNVNNHLAAATAPSQGDSSVEVRARTAYGDITVRRSRPGNATPATGGLA